MTRHAPASPVQQDRAGFSSIHASHLIGGVSQSSSQTEVVRNPANWDEVVGTYTSGTPGDADAAIQAAKEAFEGWAAIEMDERASVLGAAAERVLTNAEERARTLVLESGKVLAEAQGEMRAGSRVLSYYAEIGRDFAVDSELPSPNGSVKVVKKPRGVVSAIVPWNAPILLGMLSVAPALLAGNTLVVKPSTEAPLALMDFLREVSELLPDGVLNAVVGGEPVGHRLVTHPDVRGVQFTGSTRVGRAVAADAMTSLKRVSLELGGNDPAIVLSDVDLDGDVVPEIIRAVYPTSGQVCYAVKRIYVMEPIFGDFLERFVAASDRLVVGNGLDPASDLGPLINGRQLNFVKGLIEDARQQGADVLELGTQLEPRTWDKGWFHLPTVVTNVAHDAQLVQAEQFGPVIPIIPVSSIEEAIRLANHSAYGLASSIWTSDEEHGFQLAHHIEAGTTFVNTHRPGSSAVDMPFGGVKQSGLGRGHGIVALDEQLELQTLSSRRPG